MLDYPTNKWFWIIAGSSTQVYDEAAAAVVPVTSPAYLEFLAEGGIATRIVSMEELTAVLATRP